MRVSTILRCVLIALSLIVVGPQFAQAAAEKSAKELSAMCRCLPTKGK